MHVIEISKQSHKSKLNPYLQATFLTVESIKNKYRFEEMPDR